MKLTSAFILAWALGFPAYAEVVGPPVATITAETFSVGQMWHWNYYQDGALYSTERYTILEARPDHVVIQMSRRIAGEADFTIHHLQEVNPQRCLQAYKNPADPRPWSIKLFFKNQGRWEAMEGLTSTLAFEEKFNCNPHRLKSPYRNTYFEVKDTALGAQELFQQRKGPADNSSWYFNQGSSAPGLMGYKRMSRPQEKVQYEIRFSISE